jgi:nucleoside-diphosphate-sugar epimerase
VQASAKFSDWLDGGARGVAITGASGWIGRAVAQVAAEAMADRPACRLRLFGSRARAIEIAGRALPLEIPAEAAPLGQGEWLVIHLAVAGADRLADPQALRALNEGMLADALALARTGAVRRLVCASSGAVYQSAPGVPDKQAYIDLKRDQEHIVRAWAAKTGAPILFPRIFNVGGPYMNHLGRYALGSFIQQALADGVIRIQARRPVLRSYVHVLELAQVTLDLALDDAALITFDTAGLETVEMADLAHAVGATLDLPGLRIERPPMQPGGEDRYVGDGGLYQAALAGMGLAPTGLHAIIADTARWIAGQ